MKTIPANLQTHYSTGCTTLARLWKVTRTDATVYGFTDHDRSLTLSGVTYVPSSAFSASALQTSGEYNVDDAQVVGVLNSAGITAADLEAGDWDGATVELRQVNWDSLADGAEILRVGTLGKVTRKGTQYVAEFRGLMQALQNNIGRMITPDCDAKLGDTRCGVDLAALGVSGIVTGVTSNQVFTAGALAGAVDYYAFGELVWTAGNNTGRTHDVKGNATGGVITLQLAAPETVQVDDTFTIRPGCDKSAATCDTKFSNLVHFRGFPHVPGPDQVYLVGGQ